MAQCSQGLLATVTLEARHYMTETQIEPGSGSASTSSWDQAFAALKARFPKAQDSVVFAIYTFQNTPDIALDDLKARAQMHGLRVTGQTINAARSLMMGRAPVPRAKAPVAAPAVEPTPAPVRIEAPAEPHRAPRRARERKAHVDVADLVLQAVQKLQRDSGSDAARLKDAIRQAVAVLQAAVQR